jgi:hypothetical protein
VDPTCQHHLLPPLIPSLSLSHLSLHNII